MKKMKTLLYLLTMVSFATMGCQERGMPAKIPYIFRIVDSLGYNLVGDSINLNRYNVDSIKSYYKLGATYKSGGFIINKNYTIVR